MTMLTAGWADQADTSGIVATDNFADRISDDDDALLELEEDYSTRRKLKKANVYIRLMANYPIVIAVISLVLGCLSFVTLVKYPLPDFDDPTAGFEARGTSISGAHRTLKLMKDHFSYAPNVSLAMKNLNISSQYMHLIQQFMDTMGDRTYKTPSRKTPKPIEKQRQKMHTASTTKTTVKPTSKSDTTIVSATETTTTAHIPTKHSNILSPTVPASFMSTAVDTAKSKDLSSGFGDLLKGLLNISKSDNIGQKLLNISKSNIIGQQLLNISNSQNIALKLFHKYNKFKDANDHDDGVTEMKMLKRKRRSSTSCIKIDRGSVNTVKLVFEEKNSGNLWTPQAMRAICDMQDNLIIPSLPHHHACNIVSLPNIIAWQQGKECKELNEADLQEFGKFIRQCSTYACLNGCTNPGKECSKYHVNPTNIGYYLMDKDFFSGNITEIKLKYTMVFYSQEVYRDIPDFGEYYEKIFAHASLQNDHVKITGIYSDVDDKFDLFNTYMMQDLKYFVLAGLLVLLILTVYLGSVALIIATLVNVVLSLGVAYFFYTVVLRIAFFPFMNVLAGIILIAVGADDVFIYYDTWQMVKKKNHDNAPQEKIVARTFRHAAVSIFVTSLTTSGAFFANYISRIAAIKCFGLFAGLAILANFFFMVTWTPSVIVLVDQIMNLWNKHVTIKIPNWLANIIGTIYRIFGILRNCCSKVTNCIFVKVFPFTAKRLWLPCILILTGIGICGFVVVFVKPRLKLPDSKEFPLFPSSHPMENYDQNLRDKFRWQLEEAKVQEMTVYFIWGAFNQDNGNRLDPNDDGHLEVDPKFSLIAPESQVWMKNFCKKLKVANFTDDSMTEAICLLDMIENTQQHICSKIKPYMSSLGDTSLQMCCEAKALPYSAEAFQNCFPLLLNYIPDPVGPIGSVLFDRHNNITGFLVWVKTKQYPTTSFVKMNKLVSDMDEFLSNELASAPTGLKNGWYLGTTESFVFYDLQNAISHGTYSSIVLSLAVACITMFLCTLNPVITIYSMVTISFAIAVTIGSLVLLGWQLNIVESVTISLAVGLSIDFTIHFGVAYVLAPALSPKDRVEDAFIRVGPAVAMAALTTFVAGASVMPSRIRAYQELGVFLMIVMATSWVYANFFFQPVCAIIGPISCQIPLPWKGCKKQVHYENPAAAEQLDIHSLSSVDSDDSDDDVALILNG